MQIGVRARPVARAMQGGVAVGLLTMACGLSGCATTSNAVKHAGHTTPTPRPVTVTGTWVYKSPAGGNVAHTVETLHLRQSGTGSVSGNGTSTVTATNGKAGHFSVAVHSGRMHSGTLTLTLYIAQLFGSGLTVVENMRCGVVPSVLHCQAKIPLYPTMRVAPQDFHRR